ncbi:MAG TPA: 2-dehydropantoate 2-reductase [Candidatus Paceibacterota bacterium]|nr:2-dehydropantoate 2-reductase [Verrucomicrobiota bacterium]HRY48596.1 2-dehydropantoate 2-reductase [Candidatus Paceibacterota bacterium]HSA00525.1 2-dehydropantoate 2-reductase [Candidatus Paceibacterota bacterium]
MKIAMVGCGALGCFYAARLNRVLPDVHFLLRSDFAHVRDHGLRIESVDGDFFLRPRCAIAAEEIGPCDVVFIGLKTTANDQLGRLLPPLVTRHTLIVTLQNGLGNEEQLSVLFGPDNILGGLCFVCVNRLSPGHIRHTAYGRIVLGEFGRRSQSRTRALSGEFLKAGIPCEVTDDLARAHWEKLIWNIPFNGLGVAGAAGYEAVCEGVPSPRVPLGPCLPTDQLLADARWEALVRDLMREVIAAGRALGHDIDHGLAELNIDRTRSMGPYRASTLLDFERGLPIELESLFLTPLRWAEQAGVPMPRLSALCRLLVQLDSHRASIAAEIRKPGA